MAQVVEGGLQNRLKGALQSLGPKGVGVAAWDRLQLGNQAAGLEITEAIKRHEREDQAFQMQVADRARRIQFEDSDRAKQDAYDKLKLLEKQRGILSQEQAQADAKTMGELSPFAVLLGMHGLPDALKPQIQQADTIYSRLSPEAQKLYAETMIGKPKEPGPITQAIDQHQRETFKAGIADRMSRASYGEDESVGEGIKKLTDAVDAGAPMPAVMQQEQQLRQTISDSNKALAKKQRELAYAQQLASALLPGAAADQADAALHDLQAEIIDGPTAIQRIHEAQFGTSTQKPPKRPAEMYAEAASLAVRSFGGDTRNPDAVLELTDKLFARMQQLQQSDGGEAHGQQKPRGGGLPLEQLPQNGQVPRGTSNPSESPDGSPATPGPVQAVEQARELTGETAKPAGDQEAAKAAAIEAYRAGDVKKGDELLRAAGLDPDAEPPKKRKSKPYRYEPGPSPSGHP